MSPITLSPTPPFINIMDRTALIARKHETIRKLGQARRELERLQALADERAATGQPGDRSTARRIRQLQSTVEKLMAEEYRLRLAIDRSRY